MGRQTAMTSDFSTLRVAGISSLGYTFIEDRAQGMSNGLAPLGLGRVLARYSEDFNVRVEVVVAIAMHETGRFAYGGKDPVFSADPSYHNFGGIKTMDSQATHRFATDALGALGLVAHVAWYAHSRHVEPRCSQFYDPRHFHKGLDGHDGRLVFVSDFGSGVWNGGTGYPKAIAALISEFVGL